MLAKWFGRSPAPAVPDLPPGARLIAAPHVSAASTHGETVLLDRSGGAYYVLNESGALIWDLVRRGATLDEIVDAMEERYDAPRERLREDATVMTGGLLRDALIRCEPHQS